MNRRFLQMRFCTILMLVFALLYSVWASSEDGNRRIDIREAVKIAEEFLNNEGLIVERLELISAKKYSTAWNDLIPQKPRSETGASILAKLNGREYWLIYFLQKEDMLGGDIGIFVDAISGKVVDVYKGK